MALKQKCTSGGSISITPADTAGNYTLTLPAETGTLATLASAAFPAGTTIPFANATAPAGWTKLTAYNDYALRVVSGTGGSTGGSVGFSSAFVSQAVTGTTDGTTLSISQIPSHTHTLTVYSTYGQGITAWQSGYIGYTNNSGGSISTGPLNYTGGDGSHTHSFTGTAINLAVQYVDLILASKN
jgi:hypothetical protein